MKRQQIARALFMAAALLLAVPAAVAGSIMGSPHDFTAFNWSGGQVCIACHNPQNSNPTVTVAPQWNHTLSTTSYTLYSTPTLKASVGQPGMRSKLCLSCHDGTVAVDSYRGSLGMSAPTGTTFISGANNLGTNLSVHHPSSFVYDAALATANGSLWNPTSKVVTVGAGAQQKTGPVSTVMLSGGQVQCSSCHDVHNTYTNPSAPKLLKMSMARSAMCFACHNY